MIEGVVVGVSGDRIANEDLYGATFCDVMVRDFSGRGFAVVDTPTWRRARTQLRHQTQLFQLAQNSSVFLSQYKKADTLPELAEALGVSASGLVDTVGAYNDAIATHSEDPGHKASVLCAPITIPPYYGVDISIRPALTYIVPGLTLGGLKIDEQTGLVRDKASRPIPDLYAAGRTAVGVCSNGYISGLSLADCVFSGKRAGEHAATTLATKH